MYYLRINIKEIVYLCRFIVKAYWDTYTDKFMRRHFTNIYQTTSLIIQTVSVKCIPTNIIE